MPKGRAPRWPSSSGSPSWTHRSNNVRSLRPGPRAPRATRNRTAELRPRNPAASIEPSANCLSKACAQTRASSRGSTMSKRTKLRFASLALLLALAALGGSAAAQDAVKVTVNVRADQPGAVINPNVYGQFAEHLGTGIYEGVWV